MSTVHTQSIKEHMSVVASDGEIIGKVDHLEGERIKLTRSDSPDGTHHYVPLNWVASVAEVIHLNLTLSDIRARTSSSGAAQTDAVPDAKKHDAVPGGGAS